MLCERRRKVKQEREARVVSWLPLARGGSMPQGPSEKLEHISEWPLGTLTPPWGKCCSWSIHPCQPQRQACSRGQRTPAGSKKQEAVGHRGTGGR